MRAVVMPLKAYAPLVINSDAVLALAVTFEGFQAITGQMPERVQGIGGIKNTEAFFRLPAERLKSGDHLPMIEVFSSFILEALDHDLTIPICTRDVKQQNPMRPFSGGIEMRHDI